MSAREAIAAAASTVDGIACTPYYRSDLDPGTSYVRLNRTEYPNAFGAVDFWDVVIVLPQDIAEAERFVEDHVPAVVDALAEELPVDRVTPQQLQINGVGTLPVVFVSGHREEQP